MDSGVTVTVTVTALCRAAGMSRQNYYRQRRRRRRRQVDEKLVLQLVQEERQLQPELGGRKVLMRIGPGLQEAGIQIGRDHFFDLLRSHDLLIRRKKRRQKTTESRHGFRVYTNRYKDLDVGEVHQAWLADLTYLVGVLNDLRDQSRERTEGLKSKDAGRLEAALDAIPADQMLEYIESIREIMEFSDVEKEIRTMCEQSAIPKALVDIAVSDPDKLDELEKQAEG